MDKKKILIISGIFFPSQYPRSHRTTELAIEFARQGHEVIVYSVLGKYNYDLFEKQYNLKVKDIGKTYFIILNSDGFKQKTFFDKLFGRLLHRLLEFPDLELMFKMSKIIKNESNIDILISIAKPFPIHWGCSLTKSFSKNKFPEIWIADCGDPYMGNKVTKKKPLFYFKYIEKWFCKNADYITIPVEGAMEGYYPEFHNKIRIIPQGFRFDISENESKEPSSNLPTFAYSGIFYKDFRDPSNFLEYLTTVNVPFKFIIYTADATLILPYLSRLKGKVEIKPYIHRNELLRELSQMDFLINFENGTNVQTPSKLIDYSITKRPIISVNSDSIPIDVFQEFLDGNYTNRLTLNDINQYKIENVAMNFLKLGKVNIHH